MITTIKNREEMQTDAMTDIVFQIMVALSTNLVHMLEY